MTPKGESGIFFCKVNPRAEIERDPKFEGLGEEHPLVLRHSLKDLERAYQNYFSRETTFPGFTKKCANQSILFPQGVRLGERGLDFPSLVCCQ